MQIFFLLTFSGAITGFYLLLCGLLSIWLALGRTSVAIRVPAFLLATLPLGLVPCLMNTRGGNYQAVVYMFFLGLAVLSAAVQEWKYVFLSGVCIFFGLVFSGDLILLGILHSEWFTTTTLALCFLALLLSLIRLIGFRLIRFATDTVSQETELRTGRDIDQWIELLDEKGAESWNRAQITIFLRTYGFDYRWQKAIAVAFEKSLGRQAVERTFDGKEQQLQGSIGWAPEWIAELSQQRFTIVHMFVWSVAAASLFGFFRLVGRFALTEAHFANGIPMILIVALITFGVLRYCLAVRGRIPAIVPILVFSAPYLALAAMVRWLPLMLGRTELMLFGSLTGYALWLGFALMLVRQRGYRLVRLQTVSRDTPG